MFIKDMRAFYDIVQSPRPSNNLVYSQHVTFMFKVTFMLVLFQGKDNSYTVIFFFLNDFIWRSNGSTLFWGNTSHLMLISLDLAGNLLDSFTVQLSHSQPQQRTFVFLIFIYCTSTLWGTEMSGNTCEESSLATFSSNYSTIWISSKSAS